MAKKHTLDLISMKDDFFEGSELMGIACSYAPGSFAWQLNDKLNLQFYCDRNMEIIVTKRTKATVHYPVYHMYDATTATRHILYYMKAGRDRLLPQLKNIDFLWMLQGPRVAELYEKYAEATGQLPGVQMIQPLPVERIEHAENLII